MLALSVLSISVAVVLPALFTLLVSSPRLPQLSLSHSSRTRPRAVSLAPGAASAHRKALPAQATLDLEPRDHSPQPRWPVQKFGGGWRTVAICAFDRLSPQSRRLEAGTSGLHSFCFTADPRSSPAGVVCRQFLITQTPSPGPGVFGRSGIPSDRWQQSSDGLVVTFTQTIRREPSSRITKT